jgi:peroxiredoxin family protein
MTSAPFSVVLATSAEDTFYEAVAFAAAARAQGKTVLLFLRGEALKSFVEDRWPPASGPALRRYPGPSASETLEELRSAGKTNVYACSAWVRMLDLDSASVTRRVDAVIGLNAFLTQAEGGPILYL